jgi:hypothetical protein
MIVFEENHIWDISNSKISQITTTTTTTTTTTAAAAAAAFSARNSDLVLILTTLTFLTIPRSPRQRD